MVRKGQAAEREREMTSDGGSNVCRTMSALKRALAKASSEAVRRKAFLSAMAKAISKDDADLLEKVLDMGGSANEESRHEGHGDGYFWPVLSRAAEAGAIGCVRVLLAAGAEVDRRGGVNGSTALFAAAGNGHGAVAWLLVESGADIEARDQKEGLTPLLAAAGSWGERGGYEVLARLGADEGARDKEGRTALMHAARAGRSDLVDWLICKGVDVSEKDWKGLTAREHARMSGHAGTCADIEESLRAREEAGGLDASLPKAGHVGRRAGGV